MFKLFISLIFFASFSTTIANCQNSKFGLIDADTTAIFNSSEAFSNYYYSLKLQTNFIAISENDSIITKLEFLQKIANNGFIPIKIKSNEKEAYKLFKISGSINENYVSSIKDIGSTALQLFLMEDTEFPNFNWRDLNNNSYTKENTKGKFIVLKFWYLTCKVCIQEIPVLNDLMQTYANREDILFISLAWDSIDELKKFIRKNNFNYQIVANQKNFLNNKLQVPSYPLHVFIDKNGKIKKVVTSAEDIIDVVNAELNK